MVSRSITAAASLVALMLGVMALESVAQAQSLRDARAREATAAALGEEAVYTRIVCGNELRAEIDWSSAGDWQEGLLIAECDKALGALEAACRAGDKRAQNVSRFVCAGDGAGATLNGRSLRYGARADLNAFEETQKRFGAD